MPILAADYIRIPRPVVAELREMLSLLDTPDVVETDTTDPLAQRDAWGAAGHGKPSQVDALRARATSEDDVRHERFLPPRPQAGEGWGEGGEGQTGVREGSLIMH